MGCKLSKTDVTCCDGGPEGGDALHRNLAIPKEEKVGKKGVQWGLRAGLTCKQVAFNYQGVVPTKQ